MSINLTTALIGGRTLLNSTLPDTAVNSRTSASVATRIDESGSGKTERLHGLPGFIRIPVWDITQPDNTDLKAGDVLTNTRAADSSVTKYFVMTVFNPTSYSVSTDAEALIAYGSNGTIPVPPNTTVTFKHTLKNLSVTADAYVQPVDEDVSVQGGEGEYRWSVMFDPTIAYTDGSKPTAGHLITCSAVLGTDPDGRARTAAITKPRRTFGIMPVAMTFFAEGA